MYIVIQILTCELTQKVAITIPSSSVPYTKQLGPKESNLAQALFSGNPTSIAKAAMSIEDVRVAVEKEILRSLNQQCSKLCRKNRPISLFRPIPVNKLADFKWMDMISDLHRDAPLLFKILTSLVTRNDGRNKFKAGNHHHHGICTAIAILLKERNREMCGLQSLVSLLMYSCHCEKQVQSQHIYS